jgi:ABC-type nitrate/sulfonate/bicarbonate transport system ATPase subunit
MSYTIKDTIFCLDKVSVKYGDKLILKDVSLIEKDVVREGHNSTGQMIAFIGRSGRGKSTLFKALTGLIKPSSGKVLITNTATEDKQDAKEVEEGDVGFVDQKYTLFRHKTVMQIFHYAMRKDKKTKEQKDEIIKNYLEDWGLTEHANKYSCELSGGQRQRTAILEQMLTSKHFMIFDEPFSGLDVGNIEKVKESFARIQDDDELNTVIFSTHDIRLAVELADSIYIVGFPEGTKEYSTVIKNYDLKEMGLAWTKYGDGHRKLALDIKELLLKS